MPVTGFKVRMLWNNNGIAVAENYYWNATSTNPQGDVEPATQILMKARSLMMGNSVVAVNYRISQLGSFRAYFSGNPAQVSQYPVGPFAVTTSLNAAQTAAGIKPIADGSADEPNVAVIASFTGATIAQHGRIFLAGIPDVLVRENPTGPWQAGFPSWFNLFNAWATLLTTPTYKWAWKARTPPTVAPWSPVTITTLQLDPTTGFWGVDCPTFSFPSGYNQMLQIRGFKMTSRAYVPVQGTLQIAFTGTSTTPGNTIYYLRGSQTWAGTQVAIFGNARAVDYSLNPFANVTPGQETTRKRGNRQLAFPGRRRVVQRVSA